MTIMEEADMRGLQFPSWFIKTACAAFLAVSIAVGGTGISTWSKADAAETKNEEQDKRLDRLERNMSDIQAIKATTQATNDLALRTNDKLDHLIEGELDRTTTKH